MRTSRISLRSLTGKLIHLAILAALFTAAFFTFAFVVLLVCYCIYLFRRERQLLLVGMVVCLLLGVRILWKGTSESPEGDILEGTVTAVSGDFVVMDGRYHLYFADDPELVPGDIIRAGGYFSRVDSRSIPHVFAYGMYLRSLAVKGVFQVREYELLGRRFHLGIVNHLTTTYIRDVFDAENARYLLLMVLGDDSMMETGEKTEISRLGITHLFAISGMHVGMIAMFLDVMFRKFYLFKWQHHSLVALFLVLYNLATGFRVSIFRATLLTLAWMGLGRFPAGLSRLDVMAVIFVGLLLYNPFYLWNIGFLLSFLISFALVLGRDHLRSGKGFGGLLRLTILANLFALPILLEANKGLGLLTVPANIFFVVFVEILFLPLAFLTLFLPVFQPLFAAVVAFFTSSVALMTKLNPFIAFNLPDPWLKIGFYVGIVGMFAAVGARKRIIGSLMLILAMVVWSLSPPFFPRIDILDVGQGDAILLRDGTCKALIDTGSEDDYDSLIGYFRGENIRKFDLLILTHQHEDHIGEADDIVASFVVDKIIANKTGLSYSNQEAVAVKQGDGFTCGSFAFTVLSGDSGDQNENNNSLVLYVAFGSERWLLMGDAEKKIEARIIDEYHLDPDVVKIGHHGSDSSSSIGFIASISPHIGLISVGANSFGHPSDMVISAWEVAGTKVFRTDRSGTISFSCLPLPVRLVVTTYEKASFWWDRTLLFSRWQFN